MEEAEWESDYDVVIYKPTEEEFADMAGLLQSIVKDERNIKSGIAKVLNLKYY